MASPSATAAHGDITTLADVKEYYGKTLHCSSDLKTNACRLDHVHMPKHLKDALALVSEEITERYYGCALVAPENLEGCSILDLGCGSGQDSYILSKLVGQNGHVTGIDMTDEQLELAQRYLAYHTGKFGYNRPNVEFTKGYIERLDDAGLKPCSYDVVVSNCVVNLSPDKCAVLKEVYKVLKEGGEFYLSDVYAEHDLPPEIRKHKVLWGECLAGALWWRDLVNLADEIGFSVPRLMSSSLLNINPELKDVVGDARFVTATYRLFKMPKNQSSQSDVTYDGKILGYEEKFSLDHDHIFKVGEAQTVSSEVATIIESSRFSNRFTVQPATKRKSLEDKATDDFVDPFRLADSQSPNAPCCSTSCCEPQCSGGEMAQEEKENSCPEQIHSEYGVWPYTVFH